MGSGLALLAASCFALNSNSAVLSYGGGATPLAAITTRTVVVTIALYLMLRLLKVPMRLERRDRYRAFALGVLLAGLSYMLFLSLSLIPVGLTILILYTYPLQVGVVSWITGEERLDPVVLAALVAALIGLALVLDFGRGGLDALGVALAACASVAFGALTILSSRLMRRGDSRPVTLHMVFAAMIVLVSASLITDDYRVPTTALAWGAFAAVAVFYTIAIVSYFAAVSAAGALPASMIMNFEPVASLFLGYVVLGQHLGSIQILGAVIVISAIVASRVYGVRRAHARMR